MSEYNRHLRNFEKSVAGLTTAMDGMHQQHMQLKRHFRKYLSDHETFTKNVRIYLDEMELGDEEQDNDISSATNRGQNDNDRSRQRVPGNAGE